MDIFCNQYGGSWGKYSHWIFLGLSKIICTRLMINLNRFESSVPLRKRVIGISQLNSFRFAYWQRDINLNPQHTLKLYELLLKMVNFQIFFFSQILFSHFHITARNFAVLIEQQCFQAMAWKHLPSTIHSPAIKGELHHANLSSTCH